MNLIPDVECRDSGTHSWARDCGSAERRSGEGFKGAEREAQVDKIKDTSACSISNTLQGSIGGGKGGNKMSHVGNRFGQHSDLTSLGGLVIRVVTCTRVPHNNQW